MLRVENEEKTSVIKSMLDYRERELQCRLWEDQSAGTCKSSQRKFCKERSGSRLSVEILEQRKGKTCELPLDLREIARP